MRIEEKDNALLISWLPGGGMSVEEMGRTFAEMCEKLRNADGGVVLDFAGVDDGDYSVLSFAVSCGRACERANRSVRIENLTSDGLRESLKSLGFDGESGFHHEDARPEKPTSIFMTAGDAAYKFGDDVKKIVGFVGEVFQAMVYLVKHPRKLDLREVLFYMDKNGADAIPIVLLICFLVGLILAFQGVAQMQLFGLQEYVADLVALSLVRELGPLMVAMICIGRAGSAFAAELGTMKVNEEIDAMNTMGLKPARFLIIPKLISLFLTMPMLVVFGNLAGIGGGLIIGVTMSGLSVTEYINRTLASLMPANLVESLIKAFVFAFIIACVGCLRGFEADNDAKGVGKATTSSVVTGIFLVVVADFLITFTFPNVMALFGVDY